MPQDHTPQPPTTKTTVHHGGLGIRVEYTPNAFGLALGRFTFVPTLKPESIVDVSDGDRWFRAVVNDDGITCTIRDPLAPSCDGWVFPLRLDDEPDSLGRSWRPAQ